MLHRYRTFNFAMPTTAAPGNPATDTTIHTMLQLATPSTRAFQIAAWGYTTDDVPGAEGTMELIETDAVAATVTAHSANGIIKLDPNMPASLATLGVSATGFDASAEGAITATRLFDVVSMSNSQAEFASIMTYEKEWPWHRMPIIAPSKFLRIRCTSPTSAISLRCWIDWLE